MAETNAIEENRRNIGTETDAVRSCGFLFWEVTFTWDHSGVRNGPYAEKTLPTQRAGATWGMSGGDCQILRPQLRLLASAFPLDNA